ncbi:hypothetical protein B8281_18270 [Cellulosimicrobium sp. TH-20]|uniref:hypothetical protein n=1 Tax=unclassified Cellulosimicrobium TaxID=2624466 RepID=UPI000A17B81A|nr:hypothetical protein [Cellulosimicrobium sp. TH-20]ARK06380.1 hypothetical protein B8281_18270 [Cellulosimicrobium sp. TH-20]
MTTTTRRLLAALVLAGSLVVPAGTAGAATPTTLPAAAAAPAAAPAATPVAISVTDPADSVRVSVEITEREVPTTPRVAVVGSGPFVVGGRLELRGTGLAPHAVHEVWLESDPVLLGTVTTDADGAFLFVATIPAGTTPGEHHVRLVPTAGGADVVSEPFLVLAAPGEPHEPGMTPSAGSGGAGGSGGAAAGGGPGSSRPGLATTGAGLATTGAGLATTGAGLGLVAALAGAAVLAGAALRRRAGRGGAA